MIVEGVVAKANEIDAKKIEAEEDSSRAASDGRGGAQLHRPEEYLAVKDNEEPSRPGQAHLRHRATPEAAADEIVWKMKDKVGMVIDGSENYKEEAMKMVNTGSSTSSSISPRNASTTRPASFSSRTSTLPTLTSRMRRSPRVLSLVCATGADPWSSTTGSRQSPTQRCPPREAQAELDEANRESKG